MDRSQQRPTVFEKGLVLIFAKFAVGATGAVGAVTPAVGHAIKSITRNSTGNYTIVFKDIYPDFLTVKAAIQFATGGAVMNPALQVKAWSYTPKAAGGATLVIQVVTLASPEVAADAPNGSEIHFEVIARNSASGQ
jgi:hypothetical protein